MKKLAIAALVALTLAACAVSPSTPEAPSMSGTTNKPVLAVAPESASPELTGDSGSTFWSNIPIGDGETLQIYVGELVAEGDCPGLQEVFDTWDRADFVVDFTEPLLDHLDTVMHDAGCYSD